MRAASMGFVLLPLLAGQIALAQTTRPQTAPAQSAPAVEDFKPASSNQGGKEYPQVNSERRADRTETFARDVDVAADEFEQIADA